MCSQRETGERPGLCAPLRTGNGDLQLLLHLCKLLLSPKCSQGSAAALNPFLVGSGCVLGTPCLPWALGSGTGVLKPVGLMPLGEAFARALLVLWLEQHCWSQLSISTAGPSSGSALLVPALDQCCWSQLWISAAGLRSPLGRGRLEQGPNPDVRGSIPQM